MILEELGPKGQIFEDLTPGDYLFEIAEPGPKGWIGESVEKDSDGNPTNARLAAIVWRLRVLQPEGQEGRNFFHRTWVAGTEEKIAKAKKPWQPSSFTYQFLTDIGVAIVSGNSTTILDDYLSSEGYFLRIGWERDKDNNVTVLEAHAEALNNCIGVRFWGSIQQDPKQSAEERAIRPRMVLTNAWLDK